MMHLVSTDGLHSQSRLSRQFGEMILFQILKVEENSDGHCAYQDYCPKKEVIKCSCQCATPNRLNRAEFHHSSETNRQGCNNCNRFKVSHSSVKVGRDGIDEIVHATV